MAKKTQIEEKRELLDRIIAKHDMKRTREFWDSGLFIPERAIPAPASDTEPDLLGMDLNQKPLSASDISDATKKVGEAQKVVEGKLKATVIKRAIQMFSKEGIEQVKDNLKVADSDAKGRLQKAFDAMTWADGRREMPTFRNIARDLNQLRPLFGNFSAALDFYSDELFFAGLQKPESMRVKPLLLDGEPGVGKTAFAQALAKKLGLPFLKLTPAGLQHGAVLTGTAKHWGNTSPGEIFDLLAHAKEKVGTGILLIDEADKLDDWQGYAVIPALLDLLEPETARTYRDNCLGICFDASHLIVILTSNNKDEMSKALLSRCDVMKIEMPGAEQKLAVALDIFDKLNATLPNKHRKKLGDGALEKLVSGNSNMDMRLLISTVQKSFSTAVTNGKKVVVPMVSQTVVATKRKAIGFWN